MPPNHLKAIWKVTVAENALVKKLFALEIGFTVTRKDKDGRDAWAALKAALWGEALPAPCFLNSDPHALLLALWPTCAAT